MPSPRAFAAATLLCSASLLTAQQRAITTDPAPNKAFPPAMESFQLPSHGALLNALVYVAAGPGPHPTVILLHGFPGNEKNLDLAQAIRRDGWNVLYFDYRGSWGSPAAFSFTHSMEDAQAALDYLRDPANAQLFRSNPKEIVLIGHSMGGLIAAYTAAHDPKSASNPIAGLGLISAADMAGRARLPQDAPPEIKQKVLIGVASALAAEGMAPLAGCTPQSLAAELIANAQTWSLPSFGPSLAHIPTLVITSDDGLAPANDALVEAIHQANGEQVKKVHIPTDHSYSGTRIQLTQTLLEGLDSLNP
jgi:pimeloyl-ACP methyl ester carboxylesterase